MAMRCGPGPVFVYETIAATRRWQIYALRAGFVLMLLVGLTLIGASLNARMGLTNGGQVRLKALAELGSYFYYTIATVQIALILVAAPAATAGSVCLDRARGSLTHMLVTDLSDAEIVVGKLTANLLPVLGLVASAVPVLALAALLGGIIPEALVTLTAVSLALALFGCALALAVSTRVSKTNEVLMIVLLVWILWNLGLFLWASFRTSYPPPRWLLKLNPFVLAWGPYAWPNWVGFWDVVIFLGVMSAASLLMVVDAVRKLRSEPRIANRRERSRWGWTSNLTRLIPRRKSPTLDANPVLWREWHRERPSKLTRFVWGVYWVCAIGATAYAAAVIIGNSRYNDEAVETVSGIQITVGLLLVSLAAPTALSEERTRGSLDVLLTTPLSTPSIVWGKWWGAYRMVPVLALLPVFGAAVVALVAPLEIPDSRVIWAMTPTGPVATQQGASTYPLGLPSRLLTVFFPAAMVLAQGAVCTSLGLALATWFKRPGRAAAASVSIYVLFAFGWPILLELGIGEILTWLAIKGLGITVDNFVFNRLFGYGLLALCPIGGQLMPCQVYQLHSLIQNSPMSPEHSPLQTMWWLMLGLVLVILTATAGALYALTLLSFEHCLGRSSEHPRKVAAAPRMNVRRTWSRRPVEAVT